MPVALLNLAASGEPIGYDIHTFSLYDADERRADPEALQQVSARGAPARASAAGAPAWFNSMTIAAEETIGRRRKLRSSSLRSPAILVARRSSCVVLAAFALADPNFLSPLNISNMMAFLPELGIIALGMTLLLTAGEFDLSVGAVFALAPVVVMLLVQNGVMDIGAGAAGRPRRLHRDRRDQRPHRHQDRHLVLPGDAVDAAHRARRRALHHAGLSAEVLGPARPLRHAARRQLRCRPVPALHLAVVVHRPDAACRLPPQLRQARQLDQRHRLQPQRGGGARRAGRRGEDLAVHRHLGAGRARRHDQRLPHLRRLAGGRHGLRARSDRHGGGRRHRADRRPRHHPRHHRRRASCCARSATASC